MTFTPGQAVRFRLRLTQDWMTGAYVRPQGDWHVVVFQGHEMLVTRPDCIAEAV